MMYNKIIDPVSLKSVDIKSIYGKNLIKIYIKNLLCGGSGKKKRKENKNSQQEQDPKILLFESIKNNNYESVRKILKNSYRNKSLPIYYDEATPLFVACQKGHKGVVRLLLDHGADKSIETTNPAGWTALRIAEQQGHSEVAALLRA